MDARDNNKPLLHDFSKTNNTPQFCANLFIMLFVVALLGIGTGYFLSTSNKSQNLKINKNGTASSVSKGTIVGVDDSKTFKDSTEGTLEEGGIEGEGQYHLVRKGGKDQYVYLTSSIVDLSQFLGRKIKVWGETQKAQTAGWLMDVGKVEVLE